MSSSPMEQVAASQTLLEEPKLSSAVQRVAWDTLYREQRRNLHSAFGRQLNTSYGAQGEKPVIMLDVEGTTTPLPFVTKVLYPDSVKKFGEFVTANYTRLEGKEIAAAAKKDVKLQSAVAAGNKTAIIRRFVEHLCELVAKNEKAPYLKAIQGQIWRIGYENGQIKGHLFEDVAKAIKRWSTTGVADVHIYSSGSIQAQILLFKYSSHGDLTPYISGYHDTTTAGPKMVAESYTKIRQKVGVNRRIIFLTDVLAEVNAATQAGVTSVLSVRPLNKKWTDSQIKEASELVKQNQDQLSCDRLLTMCSFGQLPGAVEQDSQLAWQDLQTSSALYRSGVSPSGGLKSFL